MKREDIKVGELVTNVTFGGVAIITNINSYPCRSPARIVTMVDVYWINIPSLTLTPVTGLWSYNILDFTALFSPLPAETRKEIR